MERAAADSIHTDQREEEKMSEIQQLIHWHPVACGMVLMWFFSNLVETMPSPNGTASLWYTWVFRLLHVLSGSLPRLVATLAPQYAKLLGAVTTPDAAAVATGANTVTVVLPTPEPPKPAP